MATNEHGLQVLGKASRDKFSGVQNTSEKTEHVISTEDGDTRFEVKITESATVYYICRAFPDAADGDLPADSDPVWQIARYSTSGVRVIKELAGKGEYNKQINLRTTYFGDIPFNNEYAMYHDGLNDYISVPHASSIDLDASTDFTIGIWIKTGNTTAGTIMYKGDGSNRIDFGHDASGRLKLELRATGIGDRIRVREDTDVIDDLSYHLCCGTYDSALGDASGTNVWVDAVSTNKNTLNDTLTGDFQNGGDLAIGANTGGGGWFQGFEDEPFIILDVLSTTQMEYIRDNPGLDLDQYCDDEGLTLAFWMSYTSTDKAQFPLIDDLSGNNNNGEAIGMVVGNYVEELP